jgi:hypothetical protein
MKASVGDRIVIASTRLDGPVRDGQVVEVRHADGSPPYLVQWSDDGQQALFFPGPDAHLVSSAAAPEHQHESSAEPEGASLDRHIRSWQVTVDVFESGDETSAHVVLRTEAPTHLEAMGSARRRPGDAAVPEIGDEIAVARALRRLADVLLGTAAGDIAAVEGHAVSLHG